MSVAAAQKSANTLPVIGSASKQYQPAARGITYTGQYHQVRLAEHRVHTDRKLCCKAMSNLHKHISGMLWFALLGMLGMLWLTSIVCFGMHCFKLKADPCYPRDPDTALLVMSHVS